MLIAFSSRKGLFLPLSPAMARGSCRQGCRCGWHTTLGRPGAARRALEGKGIGVQGKALTLTMHRIPFSADYDLDSLSQPKTLVFVPELAELPSPMTNLILDPLSSFWTLLLVTFLLCLTKTFDPSTVFLLHENHAIEYFYMTSSSCMVSGTL